MDVKCVFDLLRCSESLRTIFDNAAVPGNFKLAFYDQIYPARNERSYAEVFCELVGDDDCHRAQLVSSQIDAVNERVGH